MKSQTEKAVKKQIIAAINDLFPKNFQLMVVPGGFGKNGIPDHIICASVLVTPRMVGHNYGMFLGIEAKTTKGPIKGIQQVRLAEIVKASGFTSIVRGYDDAITLKQRLLDRFLK